MEDYLHYFVRVSAKKVAGESVKVGMEIKATL